MNEELIEKISIDIAKAGYRWLGRGEDEAVKEISAIIRSYRSCAFCGELSDKCECPYPM